MLCGADAKRAFACFAALIGMDITMRRCFFASPLLLCAINSLRLECIRRLMAHAEHAYYSICFWGGFGRLREELIGEHPKTNWLRDSGDARGARLLLNLLLGWLLGD